MIKITTPSALSHIGDNNRLYGAPCAMERSVITFSGKNNILYCEEGVTLTDAKLSFKGDNSVIYLSRSQTGYTLTRIDVHHDCVCAFGPQDMISPHGTLEIIASEHSHCVFGEACFISLEVFIRTSDAHAIFSATTKERVAKPKSVFIGDHVWLGQGVTLMKGTRIDSGAIVGSAACVAGKRIAHNSSWAGNPAKQIGTGIFWNPSPVHGWTAADGEQYTDYASFSGSAKDIVPKLYLPRWQGEDAFIFSYDDKEAIRYEDMDAALSSAKDAEERYLYLKNLYENPAKNRFVHGE
ncbi:MAG: hypothetical protein IJT32_03690 [Lachnospiraceae bacterium]|nr:hypothetical protein [Lachnospiraceae bacterium]